MKNGVIYVLRVRLYYTRSSLRCQQKDHDQIILQGGIAKRCLMVGRLHLNSVLPNKCLKVSKMFTVLFFGSHYLLMHTGIRYNFWLIVLLD
jgi:hypothetical protein